VEVLQLRRRFEQGAVTPQDYEAQLHAGMDSEQDQPPAVPTPAPPPSASRAASLDTPASADTALPIRRAAAQTILTRETVPVRRLVMKCPRCTANIDVNDAAVHLQCAHCAADIIVERDYCTISLRVRPETTTETSDVGLNPADELTTLQAEATMLIRVKRAAGLVGILCTGLFAYTGVAEMGAHGTLLGTTVLLCGTALLAMVIIISRHTSRARAQLTMRMRALSTSND
jgi:hypothetical protein